MAEDDIAQREFAQWEYQHQRRQQQRREREEREAAHTAEQRVVRQWLRASMHNTDFYNDSDNNMSDGGNTGHDEAWNLWARTIAREEAIKEATAVNNQIVDDLEKYDKALQERFDRRKSHFEKRDDDIAARIDELEQRVATLEAEVDELRAEVGGNAVRSVVTPLLTFKGKRDAA